MAEQIQTPPSAKKACKAQAGFSLIEVVFSLGLVAFTCVTILGAIPIGLSSFQQANGATVEAQIVQNLTNDILLANFSDLYQYGNVTNNLTFYYDHEGSQLLSSAGATSAVPAGAAYTATVSMVGVDLRLNPNSTVGLINNQVATSSTPVNTSAYNVTITLAAITKPTQKHLYTFVAANNNL